MYVFVPFNVSLTTGMDFEGVWKKRITYPHNEKTNSDEKELFYCNAFGSNYLAQHYLAPRVKKWKTDGG